MDVDNIHLWPWTFLVNSDEEIAEKWISCRKYGSMTREKVEEKIQNSLISYLERISAKIIYLWHKMYRIRNYSIISNILYVMLLIIT